MHSLLSSEQLSKARRLLFMTHMAIGDYVYQRMFLKKLAETYPLLEIDLWFDDCVNEENSWKVDRGKTLQEWFEEEPFLHRFYPMAASAEERKKLIARATQENYDIIVFSVDMHSEYYAETARKISKNAYVVGTLTNPFKNIRKKIQAFRKCDDFIFVFKNALAEHRIHITEYYQKRFYKLFGLPVLESEMKPSMKVPKAWIEKMQHWLSEHKQKATGKTFFINYLASQNKRDWHFSQVVDLMVSLNQIESNATYIINLPPHKLKEIEHALVNEKALKAIHVLTFSAQQHFYELPALIQLSDYVISVETAVIHLASALNVPQIALVRYKARAWAPLPNEKTQVLFTKKLPVRISNITVQEVLEQYKRLSDQIVLNFIKK